MKEKSVEKAKQIKKAVSESVQKINDTRHMLVKHELTKMPHSLLRDYCYAQLMDFPVALTPDEKERMFAIMYNSVVRMRSMEMTYDEHASVISRRTKIREKNRSAEQRMSRPVLPVLDVSM